MADENTEGEQASVQHVEVIGGKDWFLQSMIETVINAGVEIGISLIVDGIIVSGILISGAKYFEELGESLKQASEADGDIQSIMGESWKGYKAIYDKPEDAAEDWSPPSASFIHIRKARFFSPGQQPIPGGTGVLWRGRLAAIGGWSLGMLQED